MTATKREIQLTNLIAKEEKAREERLIQLKSRLEKEQVKLKEASEDMEGMTDLLSMINNTAERNGISPLKLLDFAAKKTIGETARVVYRRKREPRAPKVNTTPKVAAVKKTSKK